MSDKAPATDNDLPVKAGKPALRALTLAGYHQLSDLTKVSENELLALHGVGPKALRLLRLALDEKGLSFKK